MFPDSEIAQKFQLGKTKCAYLVNYGITPFVKGQLVRNIVAAPFYTVSFDESMNRVLQNEQIDVQVHYWDINTSMASTRYFDSQFLLRPNAQNLLNCLVQSINSLPVENFIQLSRDGPAANWAVLNDLVENRKRDQLPPVEDIGSCSCCSLHIVSGAFQSGIKATSWDLDKILRAMWQLFHDSPVRKDTSIHVNLCETFPKRFCPTRWTENEEVVSRAIEIWDNVKRVMEEFESLAQSTGQKTSHMKHYFNIIMILL